MTAITWESDGFGTTGYGADDRVYTVANANGECRWRVADAAGLQPWSGLGWETESEARLHAEMHETTLTKEADDMARKSKKEKTAEAARAHANGNGNGAAHDTIPPPKVEVLTGHQRPGGVERARFVEALPCKMDAAEIETLRGKLVAVTIERVGKEAELAGCRETVKALCKREDSLVEQLRDEAEIRDVDCVERLYVETNSVDTIRLDTGEVVRTREATAEDRQEDLAATIADEALANAISKGIAMSGSEPPPSGPGPNDIDGRDFEGGDGPAEERP